MVRKYKHPPIVEALCEFQFIPSQPWDITIPGLLYDRINNEFPVKQQRRKVKVGFDLRPKEGGLEQEVKISQLMQFFRPDKSALVQVGLDLLTINLLKTYTTWENFKLLILTNLKVYQDIAKPKGFKRIGLRYINRIDFDKEPIELSDYFNYYPFIPPKLPQKHSGFNVSVNIPYEEDRDLLILTLKSIPSKKPGVLSLLLDFDYIMVKPESIPINKSTDWIEGAHSIIENSFESSITDNCRNLFEEEK